MKIHTTSRPLIPMLALAIAAATLAGCGTTQPARFYMLNAQCDAPVAPQSKATPIIGLLPVAVPSYLDRPQIVTRAHANELKLHEFSRWGEDVDDNIAAVLRDNLKTLLPLAEVQVYPFDSAERLTHQVLVQITRFDMDESGDTVLSAKWGHVPSGADASAAQVKTVTYRMAVPQTDTRETVATMSALLAELSSDIARALAKE